VKEELMKRKLLLFALAALVIAALAQAPVGTTARQAGTSVVRRALFAYRAGFARNAGHAGHADKAARATLADRAISARNAARATSAAVADNANAVNGIQASRTPTPNMLLPLDANGKLPSSIGAVGPVGPAGPAGPIGPAGISGEQLVTAASGSNSNDVKSQSASCPSGKKVIGGGASVSVTSSPLALTSSAPSGDLTGWTAQAQETAAFAGNWRVSVYAICAAVAG
jgi:hypothetical protein